MNQVAIYPRDSITFAREPIHIDPPVSVWRVTFHQEAGLTVTESDHESAWADWDSVVEGSK